MRYLYVALMSILFCLVSNAGTIRHDVDDQKYLDFGKRFFCVHKIITQKTDGKQTVYGIGSCVVMNSHWIVTAAHITTDSFDKIEVEINKKRYLLDKFIIKKDYDIKKHRLDIALGFCEEGFGDIDKPELYTKPIEIGQQCSIAGYGIFGNMRDGVQKLDGKLRAGTNRINERYKDMVVCDASRDKTQTSLEFLPNIGDSGGGLFIDGKLAGITSLVMARDHKTDSTYGDEAAFTEIYPHIDWILKYVSKTEM